MAKNRSRAPPGGFQFGVQLLEHAQVFGTGGTRHHACSIAFEQAEQVVDVAQVLFGHLGHIGAPAHLHGHQALGGQYLQGLAQGCG